MRAMILSADAKRDLEGIWVYIASDNFDAADKVCREIEVQIAKLVEHPGMGHTREDAGNLQYRFWKVYSYLIVYRFDETELTVVRIIHGARDIGSIL